MRGGLYLGCLSFGFFILILIELGRAPFDFSEAESELVRGYNLEYSGILFLFLFLREYGLLLSFSLIFSSLFISWDLYMCFPVVTLVVFTVLLCRRAFPRLRYDALMALCWFILLPLRIQLVFFFYLGSV